ncbi:integrase [Cryobacterium sp. MP_M5]|uniref:tyrosine-type recombinase/integrase n=1 Tax=unclassified Cryobacterium TaxID=2649013 RepID=UPI0018CA3AD2|nr:MULTISPECIES: tyrosine-type recombinase/integrase [unclassified Cryobacterium]MBG6057178.1 integrase [Cryobacterium sp. MP_M3]MEC5175377.1 integrase [Cryobacterium sp. MP_M5]
MARAWVIDLWQKIDPETGKKIHTERFGSGSRWRVDWYELQPNGTKRLRSRTFPIKAGAEEFATRTDHETRAGSYRPVEFGRKPFVRASESWLAGKKKIKPSTRHSYDRDLRTHILPRWGAVAIGSITRHDIETWVTQLQDGSAPVNFLGEHPRKASGLSAASIDRLFAITSAVLSYSHKAGWLPVNPANGVELPTILRTHHIYLSYAEVELLADAAFAATSEETDRVLIHTLAYTGMRINEALALTVGDLRLETRRATVKATWSLNAAGERVTGTPKTGSTRVVPLQPFLVDELRALTTGRSSASYVFQGPRGGPIHDHNWRSRTWRLAVLGSGLEIPGLTPHKLRHTAASAAVAAGADVLVLQQMLGHRDAAETLNTYGHLWPDRLDEVTDAVGRARDAALAARPSFLIMTKS